ncbi:glycosyl transferase [Clostridium polyendosporum]|uniref:Glycosyl transferase n=1 Tax=Clostridium polyendosporum TaxID=69208 RepID=A0A919RYS6_9CLOT|nr:glycosyltransferase [Clostridium polyendosporum]GIM28749.1 glycosyl transferase [Clostridium polyendosporum]
MKQILISSFDMSIGGVERSLIGLLESFDYDKYDIDLMLYRQQGEFMPMLPKEINLLREIPEYTTFRKSILEIIKEGQYRAAVSRLLAKYIGQLVSMYKGFKELGLIPMQLAWKLALPVLPPIEKKYDIAISYLWPHYFVGEKVNAKKKIAWIHTDYSYLEIDNKIDAQMWERFDYIVAVSESCRLSFLKKYPQFEERTVVIENISSTNFIKKMAEDNCTSELKFKNNNINIITVARLAYAKGIDDAVKACRRLLDEGYNIVWYVVGYGNEEKNIKELINNLKVENNFILLGKKINPYPYVKACDIYVQPSRYEGKAVTVTEAQILGKPVLLTNYNTAISQVKDGFDGIITDLGVDGIVSGIKKLIDNPEIRNTLQYNTINSNYCNSSEIEKLYYLIE